MMVGNRVGNSRGGRHNKEDVEARGREVDYDGRNRGKYDEDSKSALEWGRY